MDQAAINAFRDLKDRVHKAVADFELKDPDSDESQVLYAYYEFGQSLDYSIEEQRRKIREKEATPEMLMEAMHELAQMIEEFTHAAVKLLSSVSTTTPQQNQH